MYTDGGPMTGLSQILDYLSDHVISGPVVWPHFLPQFQLIFLSPFFLLI